MRWHNDENLAKRVPQIDIILGGTNFFIILLTFSITFKALNIINFKIINFLMIKGHDHDYDVKKVLYKD
jgi:hypothetical protein